MEEIEIDMNSIIGAPYLEKINENLKINGEEMKDFRARFSPDKIKADLLNLLKARENIFLSEYLREFYRCCMKNQPKFLFNPFYVHEINLKQAVIIMRNSHPCAIMACLEFAFYHVAKSNIEVNDYCFLNFLCCTYRD